MAWMDPYKLLALPWRTGRHLGRTVYAVVGDEPSDGDPFLGIFDSADIAAAVVVQHNAALEPDSAPGMGG